MGKIVVFIVWCLLGFCLALAGCRAAITAEKLEASIEVSRPVVSVEPMEKPGND